MNKTQKKRTSTILQLPSVGLASPNPRRMQGTRADFNCPTNFPRWPPSSSDSHCSHSPTGLQPPSRLPTKLGCPHLLQFSFHYPPSTCGPCYDGQSIYSCRPGSPARPPVKQRAKPRRPSRPTLLSRPHPQQLRCLPPRPQHRRRARGSARATPKSARLKAPLNRLPQLAGPSGNGWHRPRPSPNRLPRQLQLPRPRHAAGWARTQRPCRIPSASAALSILIRPARVLTTDTGLRQVLLTPKIPLPHRRAADRAEIKRLRWAVEVWHPRLRRDPAQSLTHPFPQVNLPRPLPARAGVRNGLQTTHKTKTLL